MIHLLCVAYHQNIGEHFTHSQATYYPTVSQYLKEVVNLGVIWSKRQLLRLNTFLYTYIGKCMNTFLYTDMGK